MDIRRTPDERFVGLEGYAFAPHSAAVMDFIAANPIEKASA